MDPEKLLQFIQQYSGRPIKIRFMAQQLNEDIDVVDQCLKTLLVEGRIYKRGGLGPASGWRYYVRTNQ
jgi:hypothetical protein